MIPPSAPIRIHVPHDTTVRGEFLLPSRQSHHVARVLRLQAGDPLTLFTGDGSEHAAVVERVAKGGVTVRVLEHRRVERESSLEIVLGQALSSGERMDYTVQKAVELGVSAIHPLAARRSVVRLGMERAAGRVAHWQAIAVAACEQCGRNRVPRIAPVTPLETWLAQHRAPGDGALPLLLSPRAEAGLRDLPRPARAVRLLAGPEGGWAPEEEEAARRSGFVPVRLGPRVLRTETAALAALAAMQALWGDF